MSESVQSGGSRPLAGPRTRLALTALAAASALAVAAAALAQVPPPGQPYLDAPIVDAPVAQADPSARIATLTAVDGNLSFAPAGSDQWAATGLNRPVTTGDRLWMDAGGRAELHAGNVAMRMGGATAASILNLDDDTTQVKLTQGTMQVRVRALPQDQTVEIDTPNLAFVPREPGDYRLDVAPDGSTTTVTMRHGSAVVYGDSRSIELQRGDRMRFAGTDLADAGGGPIAEDSFDRWTAARDAREDASPSARYLPREMPGYAALDDYGDWQEEPAYGAVWFPRVVSAGWAPYSVGHWAWIAPWGWTWIDDAPWGFAPSHYGRWAFVGTRWGWVPGPRVRPCYSPAVVAFVGGGGGGHGWSSVQVGGGPGVAWYPLGPRDAYRPAYRASPSYVARINRVTVNNIVMGDRGRPVPYANRNVPGAITGMPARNFVEGRPVRGMHRAEWRNLPAGEARGGPPVAPVKNSLVGAAPVRQLPPQARPVFERQAIAAHPPGRPATDDLARRFAREGGVVPGAGPAWRGSPEPRPGRPGRPGREAQPMPDVRMSQAALAAREQQPRAGRPDPAQAPDGWRGNGRGQSARPDDGRGFAGQPDAQRQAQAMQREQQQARDLQRQQQEAMERRQQDQQRQWQGQPGREQQQARELQRQQQEAMERRQQEQQRQWQGQPDREQQQARELQRQQQDAMERRQQEQQRGQQRQWADGQDRPDPARQSQEMQRQRFEQQRQMQEAQQRQAQDAQQRQMQEGRQRQQMEQQRQAQDAQRQQMEQQRQAHDAQRQQMEQQRQAAEQQRQQVERQRQMADQQRQGQEMQRQRFEQQRQMQEAQQRQAQEVQQRQAQAAQRQQMEQQRQMQEQQRQAQEQQRQMQEQQRQQAMQRQQAEQQQRAAQEQQRQAQEQQRAMQEQQRHQQEQQRQMQDRQRQQMEQQRQQQQQQQRAQHDRGQMEARNRDGDRPQ